jgi:hypothetical protein
MAQLFFNIPGISNITILESRGIKRNRECFVSDLKTLNMELV